MKQIILTTPEDLENTMYKVLNKFEKEKSKGKSPRLYSINQVANKLHLAHATVKKLIRNELIKTTKDGKITEDAINEYLNLK
jgi:predicted MarR family transcription regulator